MEQIKKIKDFFVAHKTKIVSVLSAILTFVIALSNIDMGAKVGIVVSILLVVLPVLIALISDKDIETTINLLVNAIVVIQDIVNENKKKETDKDNKAVKATKAKGKELTAEEIREIITKGL